MKLFDVYPLFDVNIVKGQGCKVWDGAFVQSVRGVFNWQPWHWYMSAWNSKWMLKRSELEEILKRGVAPSFFRLFKATTAAGETIEFRANGNGYSELEIRQ